MRTFIHGGGRLPEAVDAALAHYRHQIFVGQLGWQLPMADGRFERDQYDRDDTVYVVARDADGAICGCARLLPTTRPYLLPSARALPWRCGSRMLKRSSIT
ncbi:acyl-homoserine-lactone synthase, partial [Ralstonia pseudosolanacearum]|uniref:acyl-homoserine-lactone synthase n=1 Tax=Ralstonia pseudosolanacearum TaxID=1310165 RepID=UPI003221F0F5